MSLKPNIISELGVILLSIVLLTGISFIHVFQVGVYAQKQTQSPQQGQNLTKVIEQRFGQPIVGNFGLTSKPSTIYLTNVTTEFESPHTIILYGKLITDELGENDDLWGAADMLKTQYGFKLTHVIHDGEGSKGNPGRVYLIMEK